MSAAVVTAIVALAAKRVANGASGVAVRLSSNILVKGNFGFLNFTQSNTSIAQSRGAVTCGKPESCNVLWVHLAALANASVWRTKLLRKTALAQTNARECKWQHTVGSFEVR